MFSANPPAREASYKIIVVVVLVCGGVDRGPAIPGDPGQAGQDYLRDWQQEGPELHHPALQAQDGQRRDHQVSTITKWVQSPR